MPPRSTNTIQPWATVGYSVLEATAHLGRESELFRERFGKLEVAMATLAAEAEALSKATNKDDADISAEVQKLRCANREQRDRITRAITIAAVGLPILTVLVNVLAAFFLKEMVK